MDKLEPPQAFSFDGNVSHSWKRWLKHFDFYLAATEKDAKGDKIKTSSFLTRICQKGREIYEAFTLSCPVGLSICYGPRSVHFAVPLEEEAHFSSSGNRYTHSAAQSSKKI